LGHGWPVIFCSAAAVGIGGTAAAGLCLWLSGKWALYEHRRRLFTSAWSPPAKKWAKHQSAPCLLQFSSVKEPPASGFHGNVAFRAENNRVGVWLAGHSLL